MKLSERLEAMAGSSMFDMEEVCALLEESADLARRVEDGHDVLVTHWEQAAFAVAGKPVPRIGSIVRLVPDAGQEVGK